MSVPEPGEVLAGKYRVERVLGQGGMGVVVQAMHLQLEERVAVKFLLPEYAAQPEAAARFLREARAAVKIKSEHVARVIDVGALDTGAPYMVMEYLTGRDLSEVLDMRGPMPIEEVADHLLQACEALAEAHAAGIVHRDLKPANLFLTQRADGSPVVKVLDFGISKVTVATDSGSDHSLTKTSSLMGSPLYMSPEQMRSARNVDARSDIFSLGAILFELVAGRTPFVAESLPELLAQILTEPAPSLREFRPDAPEALAAVAARCLEKDPAQRYQSVASLAVALGAFAPKRSRVSVERISRVMEAAGMSAPMVFDPPATKAPPAIAGAGTVGGFGKTGPGGRGGSSLGVTLGATAAGILLLATTGFLLFRSPHAAVGAEPPGAAPQAASAAAAAAALVAPADPAPAVVPAGPGSTAAAPAPTIAPAATASAAAPTVSPATAAGAAAAKPAAAPQPSHHAAKTHAAPAPTPVAAKPAAAPLASPASAPKSGPRAALFGDRK